MEQQRCGKWDYKQSALRKIDLVRRVFVGLVACLSLAGGPRSLPSLPTAWYGVVNTRRASLSTCSLQNCGVIEARFAVEAGGGL